MEYKKIPQRINNFVADNIEKLKQIFPNVVKDGVVDFKELEQELREIAEVETEQKERYNFTWAGKTKAKKTAQDDIYCKTLKYIQGDGKSEDTTENIYIEGDNLEALKLLRQNYYGAIKMIYIDPPYNTGNDFIYNDNFKCDSLESDIAEGIRDENGERMEQNTKSKNKYHANWLNMMYPRLRIARDLLTDDGVIFISIDDNEVHNLRKICDEIFGEDNFISTISVINNLKGRSDDKFFATCNEFLCVYAKNKEKLEIKGYELDEEEVDNEYNLKDDLGNYKLVSLRKTGKGWKREDRPFMFYPILFKNNLFFSIKDDEMNNLYSIEEKNFNDVYLLYLKEKYEKDGYLFILPLDEKNNYGRWRWGLKTFQDNKNSELELNSQNKVCSKMRATIENGNVRLKSAKTLWYKSSYDTGTGNKILKNIFNDIELFENPKSVHFLKDIFKLIDNNDIILDFFSGSATTAHAVMQLNAEDGGNRKYIMVQIPEKCNENTEAYKFLESINKPKNICEIGKERIRRAGAKILEENKDKDAIKSLDVGFKVFKVAKTNIKWNNIQNMGQLSIEDIKENPDLFDFEQNTKDIDVVYELMLRQQNIPLTSNLKLLDNIGARTYLYANTYLVCLETNITEDLIKKLMDIEPFPIVFFFRDSAFGIDCNKKDNIFRLFEKLVKENFEDKTYTIQFI